MRFATRYFLEVDVIGRGVENTVFSSALMIDFVYEMMVLIYENTYNSHTRGEWR